MRPTSQADMIASGQHHDRTSWHIDRNYLYSDVKKAIFLYGLAIAAAAFGLTWLDYQYQLRRFTTEIYMVVLACLFTAVGIWVGIRLTGKTAPAPFVRNERAINYLKISDREYDVLELLAGGSTNKEIADKLFISTNTVKTHLGHLYDKLEVSRRAQAVHKAKSLKLIP